MEMPDAKAPLKGNRWSGNGHSWSSGLVASCCIFRGRSWDVESRANESLTAWMGFLSSYNGNVHSGDFLGKVVLVFSSLSFFLPASQVVFNEDFLFYVPYTLLHTSHIHISAFFKEKDIANASKILITMLITWFCEERN